MRGLSRVSFRSWVLGFIYKDGHGTSHLVTFVYQDRTLSSHLISFSGLLLLILILISDL